MNIYRTEFFATCPSNGVRIKYELTLETKDVVGVEALIAEVDVLDEGYHEELADTLAARHPNARVTLRAFHHGVHIEATRP